MSRLHDNTAPVTAFSNALLELRRHQPSLFERGRDRWLQEMAAALNVDALNQPDSDRDLLFTLHTAYAYVVLATTYAHLSDAPPDNPGVLISPSTWTGLGILRFVDDMSDLFGWFTSVDDPHLHSAHHQLTEHIWTHYRSQGATSPIDSNEFDDHFRSLYQSLISPDIRHRLGEYYTPDWLARRTLAQSGFEAGEDHTLLDPACGSGVFLMAALDAGASPDQLQGIDLNPLAVLAARANLIIAHAAGATPDAEPFAPAVYWADTIPRRGTLDLFAEPTAAPPVDPVTHIVGNPPWVGWETLPPALREALKPSWEHYGLFTLSGSQARLGGGKKELSMLFTYVCADHYLLDGGRLCFLMNRGVLTTTGAGDGFRRFQFTGPSSTSSSTTIYLQPQSVHDYSRLQPFQGATTQTVSLCVQRQRTPTDYPVDYVIHHSPEDSEPCLAQPLDLDAPGSPWVMGSRDALAALQHLHGPSHYRAREGANTGGLNGCFWVQELEAYNDLTRIQNLASVGKLEVPSVEACIEPDLLYPLLRSRDLERWQARPRASIIVAQDPQTRRGIDPNTMAKDHPHTLAYLRRFEGDPEDPQRGTLRGRALFKRYFDASDPFYSMYGIGPYTLAPWKVCWTRIDTELRGVVVGPDAKDRPVIPQETITFVPFNNPQTAHYFCALFNSAWPNALVQRYSSGKGFASAHILEAIAIDAYQPTNPSHQRLSELSRQAHRARQSANLQRLTTLQKRIDDRAAAHFGLDARHCQALSSGRP